MTGLDSSFLYAAGAATTTAANRENGSSTLESMTIDLKQNVSVDKRTIACKEGCEEK